MAKLRIYTYNLLVFNHIYIINLFSTVISCYIPIPGVHFPKIGWGPAFSEGAYLGRGRGNAFLNDLVDADSLVHVVDASGRSDAEGVDHGASKVLMAMWSNILEIMGS